MGEPTDYWLKHAEEFLALAERARAAGEMHIFVETISLASQCVAVARNLENARDSLASLKSANARIAGAADV